MANPSAYAEPVGADYDAPETTAEPTFTVLAANGLHHRHFIGIVSFVGRRAECDICLNAPGVSELHCVLSRTMDGLVLRDCSASGVYLNGQKVTETLLTDGDQLKIGSFDIRVNMPRLEAASLADETAGQEMLQQMARRISRLDARRKAAVKRAWKNRKSAPPGVNGKAPSAELASFKRKFEEQRSLAQSLQAEVIRERARASSQGDSAALEAIKAELERERAAAKEHQTRLFSLEAELAKVRKPTSTAGGDASLLQAENKRLQAELSAFAAQAAELQSFGGLQQYEAQLNEFRDQLSSDAEGLQQRESAIGEKEEELRIREEQIQQKVGSNEAELAAERARIKRDQASLERAVNESRLELEQLQREAENLERDERLQKLRTQMRTDAKDVQKEVKLSDKIGKFLKNLTGN
jgi:predicted component of type VI protein secretion system